MSASARTGPPGSTGPAGPDGPAGASADISGEAAARQAADATLTDAAAAAQATANAALPKAGGTMTGKIVLDGDPTASLHPATRQYVLAQIAALINGAPGALDTLKEIADQLSTDEGAVAALTSTVAGKLAAASNLADLVNAATARTNLGLGSAATHPAGDFDSSGAAAAAQAASQPLDSDLTAIAALTTTAFGRGLLTQSDAAAVLAAVGAVATGDSRLSDTRTPTDGSVTNAKVATAAAIAYSKLALAGAIQVVDLAFDPATQVELDAESALRVSGDALAVPKSLADAKGDLFVATADDTPARLAVGTNGTVLTADSTQAKGVKWAASSSMPVTGYEAGLYYPLPETTVGGIAPTLNELRTHPFVVTKTTTFDRIACEVTAAQASGLVRLGIYADNGNGAPGTLVVDAGTVSAASTGLKAITISQSLSAGVYWLAGVVQGAAAVSVRTVAGQLYSHYIIGYTDPTVVSFSLIEAMVQASVSGAMPSPFVRSGFSGSGSAIHISLRAA